METSVIKPPPDSGFTLIELSIVLVIIGLITGSILVGRDLIEAAQIRATIRQYEQLTSAVNTFRVKYDVIPGDMPSSTASSMGFFAITGANANMEGYGDGNGILENGYIGGKQGFGGELNMFWRHLSEAGLISGSYGTQGKAALVPATGAVTADLMTIEAIGGLFPPTKVGAGGFWYLGLDATDKNYYALETWSQVWANQGGIGGTAGVNGYTTLQFFAIDTKLDDGAPATGRWREGGFPGDNCQNAAGTAYDMVIHPSGFQCTTLYTYNIF